MKRIERYTLPAVKQVSHRDVMDSTENTVNHTIKTFYAMKSIKIQNHYVSYLKLI